MNISEIPSKVPGIKKKKRLASPQRVQQSM